jgi:hypothetical protein
VRGKGGLAALSGWIPKRQLDALRARLDARFHGCYWLDLREPTPAEVAEVPSLVRYPGWLAPFVPLVKSYGVPRYGEFDPALPFALTWLLLFGAMFGDVGHGAVILLLAATLHRRLGPMAWVGVAAGGCRCCLASSTADRYEDLIEPSAVGRCTTRSGADRRSGSLITTPAGQRLQQAEVGAPPKPCSIPAGWPGWRSISAPSAGWRALPGRWMSPGRPRGWLGWALQRWLRSSGPRPGQDWASVSW